MMITRFNKKEKNNTGDLSRLMVIVVIQAVFVIAYVLFLVWVFVSDAQRLYIDDQISIWLLLSYLIPVVIGPPLIFILIRSLLHKHEGTSNINFLTYVDQQFYSEFVRFSSKHRPKDRDFWILFSQKNNRDTQKKEESKEENINTALMADDQVDQQDAPLENMVSDLPDYNPNGPNPFA